MAIVVYERLHLLKGIAEARRASAAGFQQSWIKILFDTVYDATIVGLGTLLDRNTESHGVRSLAFALKQTAAWQKHLPLICDLELAADKLQSPYREIQAVRHTAVAHNTIGELHTIFGPTLDELSVVLEKTFELLSRVSEAMEDSTMEVDVETMRKLAARTTEILNSGMACSLPAGVVRVVTPSTPVTGGA